MNLHLQTFELEFKREAKFLKSLNHPHIIKMIHSKMRGGGSNGSDDGNDRPKSGESHKSNNSSSGEENDSRAERGQYTSSKEGFE